MKVVIQRVKEASVAVNDREVGKIKRGLLLFLGVGQRDTSKDVDYLIKKIINLRIFPASGEEDNPRKNISLVDINGEALVVSQFTLYGNCRKGRKPSYDKAASPEIAEKLYREFLTQLAQTGIKTESGVFQAMMEVKLNNWGPVTLLIDTDL